MIFRWIFVFAPPLPISSVSSSYLNQTWNPKLPKLPFTSAQLSELSELSKIKMTEYHDKGFAVVDLMDPRFAADLWRDIDQDEIRKLLETVQEKHWRPLTFPKTQNFLTFNRELENNMYKCWERYGNKSLKPKIVEQDLMLFVRTQSRVLSINDKKHVVVMVPLTTISQQMGLPTLLEGSHRKKNVTTKNPCDLIVQLGQALMFDTRLTAHIPQSGGGVLVATVYDLTGT